MCTQQVQIKHSCIAMSQSSMAYQSLPRMAQKRESDLSYFHCGPKLVFPPAPKKGMVKSSRKGHFQRAATCKEGTYKRAATCKEGTFKTASFIFSLVLSSFTFLSQFTNPLEAGCCYCQPFKQNTLKILILISTCLSKKRS